jgi:hypothetical protein
MTRTNTPSEDLDAENHRASEPDARQDAHDVNRSPSSELDAPTAASPPELAGEKMPQDPSETADSVRRATGGNEPRV